MPEQPEPRSTDKSAPGNEYVYAPGLQFFIRGLLALLVVVYSLFMVDLPTRINPYFDLLTEIPRVGLALSYFMGHLLILVLIRRFGLTTTLVEMGNWLDTGAAFITWFIDPREPGAMMLLVLVAAIGNGIQHRQRHFRHILWGTGLGVPVVVAGRGLLFGVDSVTISFIVLGACLLMYAYFLINRLDKLTVISQTSARELKEVDQSLQRARRNLLLLERAVQTTRTGITVKDCSGNIIFCNPAEAYMHGYDSPEDLTGKSASVFGLPQSREPLSKEIIETYGGFARESTNVRKDGSQFTAYLISDVIRDEKGTPIAVVTVCEDISYLKQAQEELVESHVKLQESVMQRIHTERLTALGELSASIAHELNQPLNAINVITQTTLKYLDSYDKGQLTEELREVLKLVSSMAQTVDQMRLFTRRYVDATTRPVNIEEVIDGALRLTHHQLEHRGIDLLRKSDEDLPKVEGDPVHLEQVVLNLILNARDALAKVERNNKRITIRTGRTGDQSGKRFVVLEVEDNGTGVPKDARENIFNPFFTTKRPGEGTGLGLSIASRIVGRHNGTIYLESEEGQGSLFRVVIPALPD